MLTIRRKKKILKGLRKRFLFIITNISNKIKLNRISRNKTNHNRISHSKIHQTLIKGIPTKIQTLTKTQIKGSKIKTGNKDLQDQLMGNKIQINNKVSK